MLKKFLFSYFIVFIAILLIMSLSTRTSEKIRGKTTSVISPVLEGVFTLKHALTHPGKPSPFSHLSSKEKIEELTLINQTLQTELSYLKQFLNDQESLLENMKGLGAPLPETLENKTILERLFKKLHLRLQAVPARIIFRSLDTWNQSLWINIGETLNEEMGMKKIEKNSPVLIGDSMIGVVDYVGKNQSRVCLLGNRNLTPSVRVARGGENERLLYTYIENLQRQLSLNTSIFPESKEKLALIEQLKKIKEKLNQIKPNWYLAKGELTGNKQISRQPNTLRLRGTGFNYDFSDSEGEARDLQTGKSLSQPNAPAIPLLQINDLLITTGLDGIFPPDFQVATVSQIDPLKEGDYFYSIEAIPTLPIIEEMKLVFVLPPYSEESFLKN